MSNTPADVGIGEIVGKNGKTYPVYYLPPPTGETEGFFVFVPLKPAAVSPFKTLRPGQLIVDVSKWQGNINAQKLHDEGGVDAAYLKCTDGMDIDPDWAEDWRQFKQAGIGRGAFHFWRTKNKDGSVMRGADQGSHLLLTLGADVGEFQPALDYEPAVISQPHAALVELEAFEALMPDAYRLYSSLAMWPQGYHLKRAKVWSADYTEPLNVMTPYTLADVVLWQVGVTKLPGIDGWVDVDMVVEGMTPPIDFPNWAYKRTPSTGPHKDKLYLCEAADKTKPLAFYDKPRGTAHTTRIQPGTMDVWKVSFLDGGWVCVVTGAKEWWAPVGQVKL